MLRNRASPGWLRRAARLARTVIGLSLVSGALHVAACQSIAGIVDRHYEPISDAGSPTAALCNAYCNTVMDACVKPFTVYPSKEACMGVCAKLDPGVPDSKTGNSVTCRAYQAKLARSSGEMDGYCPAAGPGGAGVCGENCDSYCTLYKKICPDDASENCEVKCRVLLDDGTFDAEKNHAGDTLQCRLVHTGNATLDPDLHCTHAGLAPRSGSPCAIPIPNCDDYCRVVMAACTDNAAVYESAAQCKDVCGALTVGASNDSDQDTLGCRTYHAYNALDIGASHCPHAGPGGDGRCGTGNCPPYCQLLAAACPGEFTASFADAAACETDCATLGDAAKDSKGNVAAAKARGGDSVTCRLLHVARAFSDKIECAKALSGAACE